jgi:hypothetical protein
VPARMYEHAQLLGEPFRDVERQLQVGAQEGEGDVELEFLGTIHGFHPPAVYAVCTALCSHRAARRLARPQRSGQHAPLEGAPPPAEEPNHV